MTLASLAALGVAVALVANIYATLTAVGATGFLRSQVRNQVIFVWLVPIVGSLVVILFHRSMDEEDPRDDGGNSSEMTDNQLSNYWIGGDR